MNSLNIIPFFTINSSISSSHEIFEKIYNSIIKKILSYLYTHSQAKMCMFFTGPQYLWFEENHPEVIQILSELVSKKQVELLGGGFYNPVFPLLFPMDRSGQIELLTSQIRKATGKRPRGAYLLSSVWDNSIIQSLQTCSMEYVLLDSTLIPPAKRFFLPQIVSDQGKIIRVLPVYENFSKSVIKDYEPENYISSLIKHVERQTKKDRYSQNVTERVITINLETDLIENHLNAKWLEDFYETGINKFEGQVKFINPAEYIHNCQQIVPSYINAGLCEDIAKWSIIPYEKIDSKLPYPVTINDFLNTYSRCHALYNRVLYISMLINNCHGDKLRKKAARDQLWKAQSGEAFVCSPEGIFANNAMRQSAYRNLTQAEKYIREAAPFKESITSYDYNTDGYNEYICAMENYTACISQNGAQITELNILHNTGNYADNMRRLEKFDKVSDNYERGLFVEHLFNKDEFSEYKKGHPTTCGIFSQVQFKELEVSNQRKEIKLSGTSSFSNLNLPVTLRKKFIMNSNGFTVQYILKNESPVELKGYLVVESNFAQTDFTTEQINSYKVEVISKGEKNELECQSKPASLKNISYTQITDTSNDISFVYEPNEEAEICARPLYFKRPSYNSSSAKVSGTTFVSSLIWEVDLPAGLEMEKNITFAIIIPKKKKHS